MPTATTSARILAPEQFVKHIHVQFGVDLSRPYQGRSPALQRYLLALGGLDHDTVYERDRQLKIQNILAAQALAWEAAERIVAKEKTRLAFTVDDLFMRVHSRPPLPSEIQFFEERILHMKENNAQPAQIWTAVVYILLASVEFWSL